ncbi:MAG: GNAT family N-acetyltransferase [Spirochaetaceae bacterium]|jgi:RimJ/RimL family protein N-acetyltransferase|nr:GNAT family N-acetyltransferase [Spirochaetaceae bacterium]
MPIFENKMNTLPSYRWRKAHETEKFMGEMFLREREKYCVSACARFRNLNFVEDHAWVLSSTSLQTAAMILHSRRTIFPVFNGITKLNIPTHLYRALSTIKIHALHGLAAEIDTLLKILAPLSLKPTEHTDYYLMALDSVNDLKSVKAPPKGITLRRPKREDIERLLPIQAAYEREEVLPAGAILDPVSCRFNLQRILTKEQALIAEINGKIVGKINTNANAYSRCQIGGVYVLPEYRGSGIASCMTAAFVRLLLAEGLGMTLFVRKHNEAALRTYLSAGFKNEADYKIVYL